MEIIQQMLYIISPIEGVITLYTPVVSALIISVLVYLATRTFLPLVLGRDIEKISLAISVSSFLPAYILASKHLYQPQISVYLISIGVLIYTIKSFFPFILIFLQLITYNLYPSSLLPAYTLFNFIFAGTYLVIIRKEIETFYITHTIWRKVKSLLICYFVSLVIAYIPAYLLFKTSLAVIYALILSAIITAMMFINAIISEIIFKINKRPLEEKLKAIDSKLEELENLKRKYENTKYIEIQKPFIEKIEEKILKLKSERNKIIEKLNRSNA